MPVLAFLLSNWKWVLVGLLVAALVIQTGRLDLCQKERHEDKVGYEAKIISLQGSLRAQNEAITQLGKESAERKAKAEKGLKDASRSVQAARTEAERLRALSPRKDAPTACPAGQAVQEIRKGLVARE